jgi:hypothetical protein
MGIPEILAAIDQDIATLEQARALLSGAGSPARRSVGRPKKEATYAAPKPTRKKKRKLSPEGRKRIAEAAKKRWAAQRAAEAK